MNDFTAVQAMRIFNRILNPITRAAAIARDADAGFDGGEFSGRHHDILGAREEDRVMALVAARTGIDRDAIWTAMCDAEDRMWYNIHPLSPKNAKSATRPESKEA